MESMKSYPLLQVALLAGGTSGEREISLASGKSVYRALISAGCNVVELDPAKKDDLSRLIIEDFDVAFLCTHGSLGENGALQGFLEIIGLPYTGSGVSASALAMDKAKSKLFYEEVGLQTPSAILLSKEDSFDAEDIFRRFITGLVVKPVSDGSSLGVYIVHNVRECYEALDRVFSLTDRVLVEQYIHGRELTVAVLDKGSPDALPVIEIIPQNVSYDYESKYAPGGSKHICPADLECPLAEKVKDWAVKAHNALGCSGVSRSDFILDDANELWILETNTIPGMTDTSLLPDAARAVGISFEELCLMLIESTLQKSPRL